MADGLDSTVGDTFGTGSAAPVRDVGEGPPHWLIVAVVVLSGAVACFGAAGLLLAMSGSYRAWAAFMLGALLLAGFLVLVVPTISRGRAESSRARFVAIVGIVAVVLVTGWNIGNASQHVLIDRDGGAYANAGRWIARSGSLEVSVLVGPFRDEAPLAFTDVAVVRSTATSSQAQFLGVHTVPALLAEGWALGGDRAMFAVPALLGGIALLTFFVVAWRLLRRPWFALVAVVALALVLPQVWFARDTYTEIPTQVLVFGALVLLVDARVLPDWRLALGAGLLLGTTQAVRIDALLIILGLPMVATIAWLGIDDRSERARFRCSAGAMAAGLVPGFVLGWMDLERHSRRYLASNWTSTRVLLLLSAVVAFACIVVLLLQRPMRSLRARLTWHRFPSLVAGVVFIGGLGAWFLRPIVAPLRRPTMAAVQRSSTWTAQYVTMRYETSMRWIAWYLGPITVFAAIVAAACLARVLLRGRSRSTLMSLAVLAPMTLVYLWDARVYTDQVWVMRRFLTTALPLFVLLAVGLAARLWHGTPDKPVSAPWRALAGLVAVAAIVAPGATTLPLGSMRAQGGYLGVVQHACRLMGDRPAVLVLHSPATVSDVREDWLPQTLRGWCGATAAAIKAFDPHAPQKVRDLAAEWKQAGRRLFVVASAPGPVYHVLSTPEIVATRKAVNFYKLESVFDRRPTEYVPEYLQLFLAPVPAAM